MPSTVPNKPTKGAVEPIVAGEFHIDIGSPLIDIHRRNAGAAEKSAALRVGEIAWRDEALDKRLHGSVARGCHLIQLGLVQNEGVDCEALPMAQAFIADKKVSFIFFDRPAQCSAEVIALQG